MLRHTRPEPEYIEQSSHDDPLLENLHRLFNGKPLLHPPPRNLSELQAEFHANNCMSLWNADYDQAVSMERSDNVSDQEMFARVIKDVQFVASRLRAQQYESFSLTAKMKNYLRMVESWAK